MTDANLFDLYSQKLLDLAMNIPHIAPISSPSHEARARSPICGSQIDVAFTLENEVISEFSQNVKACALGQASASIFGASVIGRTKLELETLRKELAAFLAQNGPVPSAPFQNYEVMSAAQPYQNRHASILLAVDATLKALNT